MSVRAIIFGATGMVGEGVLHESLKDPAVDAVLAIVRRPIEVTHPRLREIIQKDFFDYRDIEGELKGYTACFFCLGVTSIGKKEDEYRSLTYDLTMAAARTLARLNPGMVFCYVSGAGTDSTERGRSMWARVKGKTENDLARLPFKAVYAFRPALIRPTPGLKRTLSFAKPLTALYPALHMLMPGYICTLEDVGRAMIDVAEHGSPKRILESRDITEIGQARASRRTATA